MLGAGWWLSDFVRGLARHVHDNASRLGLEMLGIELGLVALAVSIAWVLPGRVDDRLGLRPGVLPTSAVLALVIGTLGLSQAINGVLQLTRTLEGSVMVGISRGTQHAVGWSFLIAFVGSALAPALGEELLCRGVLQRTLTRWVGGFIAILVSSLFFGWLHMELVHGVVATCIGLYLGLATHWSDSLRPAIAGHALNNSFALLASKGLLVIRIPIVLSIAAGLAIAAAALLWAYRLQRRSP
jgi:membrane protease YdiL (CAAX protease family)